MQERGIKPLDVRTAGLRRIKRGKFCGVSPRYWLPVRGGES